MTGVAAHKPSRLRGILGTTIPSSKPWLWGCKNNMEKQGQTGRLERIWLKRNFRGPMDQRETALLVPDQGLEGNANRGGKRQVTLLDVDSWEEMASEMGEALDPSLRRANLLVSGLSLRESRGRVLAVGKSLLRINGETRPCERMEEACTGLQEFMRPKWRGGAYAQVLEGGEIRVGDAVRWEEEHPGLLRMGQGTTFGE